MTLIVLKMTYFCIQIKTIMKKIKLLAIAIFAFAASSTAQDLPQPSPYAEVMQRVGLTDITIEYSRPGVKDRKIFGDLEPYNQVWRTGANSATKITLSTDAIIGGVKVKAGTYSVFTIPGESEWKLMLNTDLGASENSYKEENTVANISIEGMKSDLTETLLFSFDNVKDESADLIFAWENVTWNTTIKVASKEEAVKNIESKIKEIENAYGVYNSSAKYYLNAGLDIDKALEWSKKSVEIAEKFWNVYTLSLVYEAKGDKKNALATAKKSLELSKEAEYAPYIKMNTENIAKWSK
jgi:tetratricopeptide (TPR) repeat protein